MQCKPARVTALTEISLYECCVGLNCTLNSVFEFSTEMCNFKIDEGHELFFFLLKFDLNSTENICGLWFFCR